jgi:DNA-binding NarL/FixJ family response regulator
MEQKRSAVLSYDKGVAALFTDALLQSGYEQPECSAGLGVAKLGKHGPSVLMMDFDHIRSDKFETIRQVRFVLPECAIAVISSTNLNRRWARRCHMAGANGVFPGGLPVRRLVAALKRAVETGCFTDPAFKAGKSG